MKNIMNFWLLLSTVLNQYRKLMTTSFHTDRPLKHQEL